MADWYILTGAVVTTPGVSCFQFRLMSAGGICHLGLILSCCFSLCLSRVCGSEKFLERQTGLFDVDVQVPKSLPHALHSRSFPTKKKYLLYPVLLYSIQSAEYTQRAYQLLGLISTQSVGYSVSSDTTLCTFDCQAL